MQINKGGVLKKNRSRPGRVVELPSGASSGLSVAAAPAGRVAGPAQARIIESNSDYAIVEIRCGCGQKSFVQCNYGNVSGG